MLSEFREEENQLQQQLNILEKQSETVQKRKTKQDQWLQQNGYKRPYSSLEYLNDLNVIKYNRLTMELSEIDNEIYSTKSSLRSLKYDMYFLEKGCLIGAYAKNRYKVRLINNKEKHIEEIYCNDYNTYLDNENIMVIVYELVKGKVEVLPYEKIVYVKEEN